MGRIEYKYLVAIVAVFGLFMELLDATIVNVAIPTLAKEFNAGPTSVEWVVTGYLLSLAVFIPVSGWAGDRFGTKRTFMFALTVFTIASALCSFAWDINSLIAFRVLQGVGGGMLTPVGTAMVFRTFPPHERSKASGFMVIPTTVAPASGPVLGGLLVDYASWHWIFLINIPIGILGLFIAGRYLQEHREPIPGRFDPQGFVLAAAGFGALLYALAEAGGHGFDDSRFLIFGPVGVALLTIFVFVELRAKEPMINVRLFTNRLFTACNLCQFVAMVGFSGTLFLLPIFLQTERGMTPFESGLTTFPQALGVMAAAGPVSRLYPRIGPRRLMVFGLIICTITIFALTAVDLDTNVWWIRLILVGRGIGFGFLLVPLQAATFGALPPAIAGRASSVFSSSRMLAQSFGVAILATVLSTRLGHYGAELGDPATSSGAVDAFHDGFLAATAITLIGVLVAFFLVRDRDAAATMRGHAPGAPGEGRSTDGAVPAAH